MVFLLWFGEMVKDNCPFNNDTTITIYGKRLYAMVEEENGHDKVNTVHKLLTEGD